MNGNLAVTVASLRQSMDIFPEQWRKLLVKISDIDEFTPAMKERLEDQGIFYLGDLTQRREHTLLTTGRNSRLQKPSLEIVKNYLQSRNLNFGMSIPEWPKQYDLLHAALPTIFAEGVRFTPHAYVKRGMALSKNEIMVRLLLTQSEAAPLKPRGRLLLDRLLKAKR